MLADRMYLLLFGLAIVFGGMALWSYVQNDRKLTVAAKVRVRMALLFVAFGLYLLYSR